MLLPSAHLSANADSGVAEIDAPTVLSELVCSLVERQIFHTSCYGLQEDGVCRGLNKLKSTRRRSATLPLESSGALPLAVAEVESGGDRPSLSIGLTRRFRMVGPLNSVLVTLSVWEEGV
jgi:hypothetical protein